VLCLPPNTQEEENMRIVVSEAARKKIVNNMERIAKTNTPAGRRAQKALKSYHKPKAKR
jgi:hypothetical protein